MGQDSHGVEDIKRFLNRERQGYSETKHDSNTDC